jgi:GNAT superfamily N-acetyltransferase
MVNNLSYHRLQENNLPYNLKLEIQKWNQYFFPENIVNDTYPFGAKQSDPQRYIIKSEDELIAHLLVVTREITYPTGKIKVLYIGEVFVVPDFQGQKIGQQLLAYFDTLAKQSGHDLSVLLCQTNVVDFYKKCGFTELQDVQILLGQNLDITTTANDTAMATFYSKQSSVLKNLSRKIFLGPSV